MLVENKGPPRSLVLVLAEWSLGPGVHSDSRVRDWAELNSIKDLNGPIKHHLTPASRYFSHSTPNILVLNCLNAEISKPDTAELSDINPLLISFSELRGAESLSKL